jgi:hypothetical protein
MNLAESQEKGIELYLSGPDTIRYRGPGEVLTPALIEELRQHKAEILAILSRQSEDWSPSDADELKGIWQALGQPKIPLSQGISICNLERWLKPLSGQAPSLESIAQVRLYLLEYLPREESPLTDPVLEIWRKDSIPDWRRILAESIAEGDKGRSNYARWMLRDVLLDVEYHDR